MSDAAPPNRQRQRGPRVAMQVPQRLRQLGMLALLVVERQGTVLLASGDGAVYDCIDEAAANGKRSPASFGLLPGALHRQPLLC